MLLSDAVADFLLLRRPDCLVRCLWLDVCINGGIVVFSRSKNLSVN